jgi:hypothetical protein
LRTTLRLPKSELPTSIDRQFDNANESVIRSKILLSTRQHQPQPRGDDSERITRARQAAEALFTSKSPFSGPSDPDSPPTDQSARKPRVLAIAPVASVCREDAETPGVPEPQAPSAVARSQFARIRTLVKYGMTVAQVAKVYEVAADEIARILRRA